MPPSTTRTHTFTGCWTCRKRRVKCDGSKPTCTRCSVAKIHCLGYGFQFDVPEGAQSKRQRLPFRSRPDLVLKLSNQEIEKSLGEIDEVEVKGGTLRRGPFAVLSFASKREREREWLSVVLNDEELGEEEEEGFDVVPGFQERLWREDGRGVTFWCPEEEVIELAVPGYLPPVNLSRREWTLFEHFNAFVGEEVSSTTGSGPHAHRHRNLITSIALTYRQNAPGIDPDATASCFHGLCAAAAMSLSRVGTNGQNYQMQAYSHERLALRHLRACIEKGSTSYQAITGAIMLLMVFDYFNDRGQTLDGHMQAALRSLRMSLPKHGVVDSTTVTMLEELLQGCILFQNPSPKDLKELRSIIGRGYTYDGFVIPIPLVDCILQIHEWVGKTHLLSPAQIANMEKDLRACEPPEPPSSPPLCRSKKIGIICYHATLIYFARSILHSPTSTIQPLVSNALSLLTALEPPQPLPVHSLVSWSAVFIGSECLSEELRGGFERWCDERTMFNLSSVKGVKEIVRLTWHLRGLFGREEMMWFDVLKGGGVFEEEHCVMVKEMLEKGAAKGKTCS